MAAGRIRHVWARPDGPTEMPGLLLGWQRQRDGSWTALVTYVTPRERIVTEWLTLDQLRPADTASYGGSAYG
ncbi:hypothetical protein KUV85_06205 [Nocardioides panacisoli]|uniref:hypothetical protein n=1 Tax=Nocardioides panacisoli TaxID=627624 RepID=UPI001C6323A0|nr:hypothetical protein [Nocardioides panacisoli]QYJ05265.1 hypothetical protein KUV85_06205 [Nocardioides panacisoli]